MDEPPVRLLLGSDAVRYAGLIAQGRAEADEKWRELSVSTDYDDVSAPGLDPLALLK
jgi:hypothetical protein